MEKFVVEVSNYSGEEVETVELDSYELGVKAYEMAIKENPTSLIIFSQKLKVHTRQGEFNYESKKQ